MKKKHSLKCYRTYDPHIFGILKVLMSVTRDNRHGEPAVNTAPN